MFQNCCKIKYLQQRFKHSLQNVLTESFLLNAYMYLSVSSGSSGFVFLPFVNLSLQWKSWNRIRKWWHHKNDFFYKIWVLFDCSEQPIWTKVHRPKNGSLVHLTAESSNNCFILNSLIQCLFLKLGTELREVSMGLYKTSIFSTFTFIKDNDLKFCTRSYSSFVCRVMRFKCLSGKVCKMMMSHFRTLLLQQNLYYVV